MGIVAAIIIVVVVVLVIVIVTPRIVDMSTPSPSAVELNPKPQLRN